MIVGSADSVPTPAVTQALALSDDDYEQSESKISSTKGLENHSPSLAVQNNDEQNVRRSISADSAPGHDSPSSGGTTPFFSPMPSLVALDESNDAVSREGLSTLGASLVRGASVERQAQSGPQPVLPHTSTSPRGAQAPARYTATSGTARSTTRSRRQIRVRRRGYLWRAMYFLGYGREDQRRKMLVSLIWTCINCSLQVRHFVPSPN